MPSKPMMAVPLFAPVVAPKVKYCDRLVPLHKGGKKLVLCGVQLQYWKTGRGYKWLCPHCSKVKE